MLLSRLKEYADERMKDVPPALYVVTPVRYLLEIDGGGRPVTSTPIDTADPSSPSTKRGQRRLAPQIQRTVGIKPLLMADNAEYTLGLARDPAKQARVDAAHLAYRQLVERCAVATGEPAVDAVRAFLADNPAAKLEMNDTFDRGGTITFVVRDGLETVTPIDLPAVRAFWAAENDPEAAGARMMQCIICGQQRPVLERLQGKIKGVPGGQTSGTALISANAAAFESYGLEASLIAPTCAGCGEGFTRAANHLLASVESRIVLGGAAFVFWTRRDVGFNFRTALIDPKPEDVKSLYESVYTGRGIPEVDETAFFGTVLSGSGGRTVVRDWIDTTVGDAKRRLTGWYDRQSIVDGLGFPGTPLGLTALAGATVRELRDIPATTPRALLRAALTGAPLPWGLLYEAVRRNRAEQRVTRPRAALIKAVLLGHGGAAREDVTVSLNVDHQSPAYHCGRLLAVVEQIQRVALGDINATVVDRFYGTASSAPVAVFPRLVKGAQPHLAKLRRDRRGAFVALDRRMQDIIDLLPATEGRPAFPSVLTLEEQGLFALGYYHQRADDRRQAREASERRTAGLPVAETGLDLDGDSSTATEEN